VGALILLGAMYWLTGSWVAVAGGAVAFLPMALDCFDIGRAKR